MFSYIDESMTSDEYDDNDDANFEASSAAILKTTCVFLQHKVKIQTNANIEELRRIEYRMMLTLSAPGGATTREKSMYNRSAIKVSRFPRGKLMQIKRLARLINLLKLSAAAVPRAVQLPIISNTSDISSDIPKTVRFIGDIRLQRLPIRAGRWFCQVLRSMESCRVAAQSCDYHIASQPTTGELEHLILQDRDSYRVAFWLVGADTANYNDEGGNMAATVAVNTAIKLIRLLPKRPLGKRIVDIWLTLVEHAVQVQPHA
ncbi:hypothetical protein FHL15_010072 [Xylaria flabelliformis]|uniref:Uncharacterized protein n=1 Tax=Xylaria flabelliformis TaxID=2512241 RepID=A0A553HM62_9PEZI|nr:hypothetical protein FHL15_010072 [Xylaria flabelliformis]